MGSRKNSSIVQPFTPFGSALKKIREQKNKTAIEVSGAVEIDIERLGSYETGETRPTEDILLLLIRHFDLAEDAASELWRLAGYGSAPMPSLNSDYFMSDEFDDVKEHTVSITADDTRIVYTDMIQVMINNYGVIINFMQGAGANNGPLAVARVGMSKEHARSIVDVLTSTLDQAEDIAQAQPALKGHKQLPSGKKNRKKG